MKFLMFNLALLLSFTAPSVAATSGFKARVSEVLKQGLFQDGGAPPALPPSLEMEYQPMVLTMVASVKSREPSRSGYWEVIEMPSVGIAGACEGQIAANFRRSRSGSNDTFVIFPGSHASFARGGYTNQTVEILERELGDPNIIALSGFQSEEFLRGRCRTILWNSNAIGADLHLRLAALQQKLGLSGERTGVIGYSGGATFVSVAMGQDGARLKKGQPPVFGLGGISVSPILDGRSTFALLDTRHAMSSIYKSEGLLTYTWRTATRSLWHLLTKGWKAFYGMYTKRPQEFIDRGYNEFTVGFLRKAMEATGVPSSELGGSLTYYRAYVELGFQASTGVSDVERDAGFDRATDIRPSLNGVKRPLLIYFSKDDPILSSYEGPYQPAVVTRVLGEASKNPNILVFNPSYGGHTSVVVDPIFPDLVKAFFR